LASLKDFINFVGRSYIYLIIKIMGKGDKKTKRGKILMGSHGVRRPRKKISRTKSVLVHKEEKPVVEAKEKAPAKPKAVKEDKQVEATEVEIPVVKAEKPPKKKAPSKTTTKATAKTTAKTTTKATAKTTAKTTTKSTTKSTAKSTSKSTAKSPKKASEDKKEKAEE